ncbi:hypothetical protein V8E53_005799 [Lactarius tabidus]
MGGFQCHQLSPQLPCTHFILPTSSVILNITSFNFNEYGYMCWPQSMLYQCWILTSHQHDKMHLHDHLAVSGPSDSNPDSGKFDQGFDRHRYDDHMDIDPNDRASEEPSIPTHGKVPHHAQHDGVLDPNNRVPEEPPTCGEAQQDRVLFIECFPMGAADVPIPNMGQEVLGFQVLHDNLGPDNIWHPFQSKHDWDFA